jgi:hypothetical protein
MTIKDFKNLYKGDYDVIEVYKPNDTGEHFPNHFHTDNCSEIFDYSDNSEISFVEVMDEDEYNQSICANSSELFSDYYTQGIIVLCMMMEA